MRVRQSNSSSILKGKTFKYWLRERERERERERVSQDYISIYKLTIFSASLLSNNSFSLRASNVLFVCKCS